VNTVVQDPGSNGYHIKLPDFEGPFELLYHLISKEKINIWDISLAQITREYLEYLQSRKELQIHLAADFMLIAASLLHLKSRLLLPSPPAALQEGEEEELFFGSKEDLVRCLLEYKFFKSISGGLRKKEIDQHRIYLRPSGSQRAVSTAWQPPLSPFALEDLRKALRRIEKRRTKEGRAEAISFSKQIEISLSSKMRQLLQLLKQKYAALECYLDDFLHRSKKGEDVVTFVAFLELARRGEVSLRQKKLFGKVRIIKLPPRTQDNSRL
jgi:segregation and condensation protein A